MNSKFRRPDYKSSEPHRRGYEVNAATPKVERLRKRQKISVFWLVPFFAALLGLFLAYNFYKEQGPLITIQFNTAEGLIAGKTPIRYRDVNESRYQWCVRSGDAVVWLLYSSDLSGWNRVSNTF